MGRKSRLWIALLSCVFVLLLLSIQVQLRQNDGENILEIRKVEITKRKSIPNGKGVPSLPRDVLQKVSGDAVEQVVSTEELKELILLEEQNNFSQLIEFVRNLHNSQEGFFYIQLLNKGFLTMTKSWICNVRQLPRVLDRTVFICTDEVAFKGLKRFSETNDIPLNLVLHSFKTPKKMVYGDLQYFLFLLFRASLLCTFLNADLSVILTEADATWFGDVTSYLENNVEESVDMVTINDDMRKSTSLNGGFLYLRPTDVTKAVVQEMHDTLKDLLEKSAREGKTHVGKKGNEQFMFEAIIKRRATSSNEKSVKMLYLNDQFLSGQWYQLNYIGLGFEPKIILNNWIVGQDKKIGRAISWGHWYLESGKKTCVERMLPTAFTAADSFLGKTRDWTSLIEKTEKPEGSASILFMVNSKNIHAIKGWICANKDIPNLMNDTIFFCRDEACDSLSKFAKFSSLQNLKILVDDRLVPAQADAFLISMTYLLLKRKVSVILMSPSSVWSKSPFQFVQTNRFIGADMVAVGNGNKPFNADFTFFNATGNTVSYTRRTIVAIQKNRKPLSLSKAFHLATSGEVQPVLRSVKFEKNKMSSPDGLIVSWDKLSTTNCN